MRLFLLVCISFMTLSQVMAENRLYPSSENACHNKSTGADDLSLSLAVDSIHHVNCLRPTGYVQVKATGGISPYTYLWSNGITGPLGNALISGAYHITATDASGATAALTVIVEENFDLPSADAGSDLDVLCSNQVVTINGSGSEGNHFVYQWTTSNGGNIMSGANTLTPVVDHSGDFMLVVTNVQNGCTAAASIIIKSIHEAPTATVTGDDLNCTQQEVTLQADYTSENTALNWQGPGNFMSASSHPTVNIAGTYIFTVVDTLTTCSVQAMAEVTPGPQATASGGGTITCTQPQALLFGAGAPANISYSWSGPGGFVSNLQNPTVTTAGTYTLKVTQLSTGCTVTSTVSVSANNTHPTVSAGTNGTITCSNTSALIFANVTPAGATFLWSGPNGYSSVGSSQPVMVPGAYQVTVTNVSNGCTTSATTTVTSNTVAPGVSASGGTLSCLVTTATLHSSSATPGISFAWKGPSNFTSAQANPVVNAAGTYTVTVTNPANGCTSTATTAVTQNVTAPNLSTTTGTLTCNTTVLKITASSTTPGVSYSWAGPNGFTSGIYNPSVSLGGVYTVTITNPLNGCTNSTAIFVSESTVHPNVFAGADKSLNCTFLSILMNPLGTSSGANYTYLWTTDEGNIVLGANSLYARADAPGTYTLTVKNTQNGCTSSDEMIITQSPPVTANATELISVSCNGTATGSAKATGSGVGTLNYSWSNGTLAATASNLSAGTYTVTVADEEGCTATAATTISEPFVLAVNVSTTAQTVAGVNNGTAASSVSGGTAPYTWKWSTGSVAMSISNLAPGNYTVTVTDNKGCTKVQTGTVNSVSCAVNGSVASTPITCFGANNGTATANLTGGTGTIHYIWSTGAITKTISSLNAGNYTVTTTDNNGCSLVLTAHITSPQPLAVNIANQNNILCLGQSSGSVTVSAAGGTAPYTFVWSNGAGSATASNLNPGTYSCTVTDAKACTIKQTAQIQLTDLVPPQLALKNATVFLGTTGFVTLTPALFDNGSIDAACAISAWTVSPTTFDCEQIGTYTVTLTATDQNGNMATGTASVTVKDNIVPTITCPTNRTVSSCASVVSYTLPQVSDNCQVFAAATLTGGLPSGTNFPVGLTQQVFSFTDYGGNTATCSFTVTVLPLFDAVATATPASCGAACNGAANVMLTGISGAATYSWSNGQNGPVVTGLCQGTYTVTVSDAAGCSQVRQVNVGAENGSAGYNVSTNTVPASCTGACDGNVALVISGGNNSPNVTWNNGQSGASLSGLCPGNYMATLTDASGCSQTQQVQIDVHDQQPPVLFCPGNIVSGNCQSSVAFDMPQVTDNCVVNAQLVQQTSGLPSGASFPSGTTLQVFQYTDSGGNAGQCSFSVTISPSAMVVASSTPVTCAGSCNGAAVMSVNSGQGPFDILWSNSASGPTVSNLCAGAHTATITDGFGCTQTQTVTITQPAPLVVDVIQVQNDIDAIGTGSISVAVSGGVSPYTYSWKRNGQFFAATEDLSGLLAGQYTLAVTDANGCTVAGTVLTISTTTTVATREADEVLSMAVYPNPARSEIFIRLAGETSETIHLQILDIQGRLLREGNIASGSNTPARIDLEDLPEGMLLLRLTDGHSVVSKVVMKAR